MGSTGLGGVSSVYQGNPSIFPEGHLWAVRFPVSPWPPGPKTFWAGNSVPLPSFIGSLMLNAVDAVCFSKAWKFWALGPDFSGLGCQELDFVLRSRQELRSTFNCFARVTPSTRKMEWVWVKRKPGDRFQSMLPFTRVAFWVHLFDPQSSATAPWWEFF